MIDIRLAKECDVEAINAIYNYEVLNGVATFDTVERSDEAAFLWFEHHNSPRHPVYVAVDENEQVLSFCSLSTYYDKDAYENTVEISLYVHHEHRFKGLGRRMLKFMLDYAGEKTEIHNIIAVVTSSNQPSISLFKSFDFKDGGTIEEAGLKFGRLLGITNLYKIISR